MSESSRDERRINDTLARAAQRQGYTAEAVTTHTPLDDLLQAEDGDEDQHREALGKVLLYFFADGPHPGAVLRRVFGVTLAIRPELILNMNRADLAMMFGETRAAQSWRIKKIFSGYQRERGVKGFKARSEKSETAVAKYTRLRRGVSNRRGNQRAA